MKLRGGRSKRCGGELNGCETGLNAGRWRWKGGGGLLKGCEGVPSACEADLNECGRRLNRCEGRLKAGGWGLNACERVLNAGRGLLNGCRRLLNARRLRLRQGEVSLPSRAPYQQDEQMRFSTNATKKMDFAPRSQRSPSAVLRSLCVLLFKDLKATECGYRRRLIRRIRPSRARKRFPKLEGNAPSLPTSFEIFGSRQPEHSGDSRRQSGSLHVWNGF
jgi:hypothetical protein